MVLALLGGSVLDALSPCIPDASLASTLAALLKATGVEPHPHSAEACALALSALLRARGAGGGLPAAATQAGVFTRLALQGALPAAATQAGVYTRLALQVGASAARDSLQHNAALSSIRHLPRVGASAARDSLQQNAALSSVRQLARVAGRAVIDELLLADIVNEKYYPHPNAASVRYFALRCLTACTASSEVGDSVVRTLCQVLNLSASPPSTFAHAASTFAHAATPPKVATSPEVDAPPKVDAAASSGPSHTGNGVVLEAGGAGSPSEDGASSKEAAVSTFCDAATSAPLRWSSTRLKPGGGLGGGAGGLKLQAGGEGGEGAVEAQRRAAAVLQDPASRVTLAEARHPLAASLLLRVSRLALDSWEASSGTTDPFAHHIQ
ncbi:hypothetical protein T484DRAFT_1785076, partial [Baffinella frigidus]